MNHPTAQPTTHTPGTWKVEREELEYSPEGMYLRGLVIHTDEAAIAELIEWQAPLEAEANARLIAAAPDLLAACKHAVAVYGELKPDDGANMETLNAYEQLLAAITQAEGGTKL